MINYFLIGFRPTKPFEIRTVTSQLLSTSQEVWGHEVPKLKRFVLIKNNVHVT